MNECGACHRSFFPWGDDQVNCNDCGSEELYYQGEEEDPEGLERIVAKMKVMKHRVWGPGGRRRSAMVILPEVDSTGTSSRAVPQSLGIRVLGALEEIRCEVGENAQHEVNGSGPRVNFLVCPSSRDTKRPNLKRGESKRFCVPISRGSFVCRTRRISWSSWIEGSMRP